MSHPWVGSEVLATADRNRVVDLVRVLALGAVVLGHWLKQGWYVDDGGTLHRAGRAATTPHSRSPRR